MSESSLKRWADEGRLAAERTAGGHRRIAVAEAVRFVRQAGLSLAKPELLGLARIADASPRAADPDDRESQRLLAMLEEDRGAEARSLIASLYLEGASLGWILDVPVRRALARIGEMWEHGAEGLFLEHRATETCAQALAELRLLVPPPAEGAPIAVGGAFQGDVYQLPSAMAALVLAEAGYAVRNLGPDTPAEATRSAIRHYGPQLVWQSFSVPPRGLREAAAALREIADALGSASLVVGGRGSYAVALPARPNVHRVDSMAELAAFARGAAAAADPG